MKASNAAWILLCISVVSSVEISVEESTKCPKDSPEGTLVTLPHESDCDKFYVCFEGDALLEECPDGLHYDPEQGTCDWPDVVNCKLTSVNPSTTTTAKYPTKPPTTNPPHSTPSTNPPSSTPLPQTTTHKGTSEPPATTAHPQTTTRKSTPQPSTTAHPQTTTTQRPTTRPPTTLPPHTTQNTTTKPTTTTARPTTRPPTTTPAHTTTQKWDDPSTCIGKCPLEDPIAYTVQLPNKRCDKFCKCSNGVAYVQSCPASLHYNRKLEVCDWPLHANCTGIGGIPSTTTKLPQTTAKKPSYPSTTTELPQTTSKKPSYPSTTTKLPQTTSKKPSYPSTTTKLPQTTSTKPSYPPTTTKHPQSTTKSPSWTYSPQKYEIKGENVERGNLALYFNRMFNPQTTTQGWQNPQSCLGECPQEDPVSYVVQLPNKHCDKFCKCSNGVAFVQLCPAKLHYNSKLKVCDWPRHANCTGIGGISTTTRRPQTTTKSPSWTYSPQQDSVLTKDKVQENPPTFFRRVLDLW